MNLKSFTNITIISCCLLLTTATKAQNTRFSIGAEAAIPVGDFADAVNTGYGGSLRCEFPVGTSNLGLMITAGYLSFAGKDIEIGTFHHSGYSQGLIPIQVGGRYYFNAPQDGFYVQVELGVHMNSYTAYTYSGSPLELHTSTKTNTNFSYGPSIGYQFANVDLGVKYQLISSGKDAAGETVNNSYVGIRLAYVFGSK